MSSSCDCVVCEHATIVVMGESGVDLFWGASSVNTLGVVFLDGGAVQCLVDGNDFWEMREGRCVWGVVLYVLEVAVVVCGEVGVYEGVAEVASVDAMGVLIVMAFYLVSCGVFQVVVEGVCKI
jgi:hypothetical protein